MSIPHQPHLSFTKNRDAFTLVELLAVISIVSILSILTTVGMRSIFGTAYSSEVTDIANTLMRARAYAMANNTYVFVGLEEVNATNSSVGPQTAGTGRVGITVVASNDGTRIYSSAGPTALTPSSLTVVSPLRAYENIHLTSPSAITPLPNYNGTQMVGATYNPASSTSTYTPSTSLTTFNWPLNGSAQYTFGSNPGTVIQFSPQGEAAIVTGNYGDTILQWIEIDLVPSHGSKAATSNPATILIDGASGSVFTYRA